MTKGKTECRLFCVCDNCTATIASSHADADRDLGREWSCQCGACKQARGVPAVASLFAIHQGFARIERLERRRAAIRALAARPDTGDDHE